MMLTGHKTEPVFTKSFLENLLLESYFWTVTSFMEKNAIKIFKHLVSYLKNRKPYGFETQ